MSVRMSARVIARTGLGESSSVARTMATSAKMLAPHSSNEQPKKASPASSPIKSRLAPLSPSAPPPKEYNALTVAVVRGIARLMGYNSTTTTAIRVTSDLFDRCAERADIEADFWYRECRLPRTYQVWFQITSLHIHLLLTRFRALPTSKMASAYSQEIINHFFIDAESRMRVRFGVQTSRLVKGYMREMHTQHRGAMLSLDEALAVSAAGATDRSKMADADAVLAAALWRNVWGAGGWGEGVGGVKRKVKGVDRPDEEKSKAGSRQGEEEEGMPELAHDLGIETSGRGEYAIAAAQQAAQERGQPIADIVHEDLPLAHDLQFAVSLQKLVDFYRRESVRLAGLTDEEVTAGSSSVASFGKV